MTRTVWVLLLSSSLLSCTMSNPDYCDEKRSCVTPERPFCDLRGQYQPLNNTCIATPVPPPGPVLPNTQGPVELGPPGRGFSASGGRSTSANYILISTTGQPSTVGEGRAESLDFVHFPGTLAGPQ